jgi:hypothetical protein
MHLLLRSLASQPNWFNPSIARQYSCSSETISRLAQQILCQYVPNGIPLLFAGGGGGCHPLGLGLIEIGAHCPNMARIERSRLARISTHLARSSGSHTNSDTNSDTPVGMPFSSV